MTLNGGKSIKTLNPYVVHLKLIKYINHPYFNFLKKKLTE